MTVVHMPASEFVVASCLDLLLGEACWSPEGACIPEPSDEVGVVVTLSAASDDR